MIPKVSSKMWGWRVPMCTMVIYWGNCWMAVNLRFMQTRLMDLKRTVQLASSTEQALEPYAQWCRAYFWSLEKHYGCDAVSLYWRREGAGTYGVASADLQFNACHKDKIFIGHRIVASKTRQIAWKEQKNHQYRAYIGHFHRFFKKRLIQRLIEMLFSYAEGSFRR